MDLDKLTQAAQAVVDADKELRNYVAGASHRFDGTKMDKAIEALRAALAASQPTTEARCSDPTCPCRDGDTCHYRDGRDGTKGWPTPAVGAEVPLPAPDVPNTHLPLPDAFTKGFYSAQAIRAYGDARERAAGMAGWQPVTKRSPPNNKEVLVACEFDGPGDWRMKWGYRMPSHPDSHHGWVIPGASWKPTMWRELPAAPTQEGEQDGR